MVVRGEGTETELRCRPGVVDEMLQRVRVRTEVHQWQVRAKIHEAPYLRRQRYVAGSCDMNWLRSK